MTTGFDEYTLQPGRSSCRVRRRVEPKLTASEVDDVDDENARLG